MGYLKTAAAAALALAPIGVSAAPIDLASFGYEIEALVETRAANIDFNAISGFLLAADPFFELQVTAFDGTDPATAAFSLFPATVPGVTPAELSGSPATAIGDNVDFLQYLFESVTGTGAFAGLDGGAVLVEFGAPGSELVEGATGLQGTITITSLNTIAPIPLPAGVVLLVTGLAALGGTGAIRRRGGIVIHHRLHNGSSEAP